MSYGDIYERWEAKQKKEARFRSEVEEHKAKETDPLISHTQRGTKLPQELAENRAWFSMFALWGMEDPPNQDIELLGRFGVDYVERIMSGYVALADVMTNDDFEDRRGRPVLVNDMLADDDEFTDLSDIDEGDEDG